LIGGRIGDRSGHKRVYLTGLGVFAVGSGLCALAPSGGLLITFRVLQGVGAAIELPATLAILTHTFTEPRERAQAVGIWAGAAGSSLVVGPVRRTDRRLRLARGVRRQPPDRAGHRRADARDHKRGRPARCWRAGPARPGAGHRGAELLAAGAIEGGHLGFTSALALGLLIGGVLSLAAFIAVERVRELPMLPLGFFRRPAYSAANADGLVMGFVTFGVLFLFALFFEQVQGDTAIAAGLRFLPLTIAFVIVGPLVGRVIDRVGHRMPMALGCALMGFGSLLLLRVHAHSRYEPVWWPFVIIGVGYGLTSTPMAAAVLGAVPSTRAGMAPSTNLTARVAGGVFAIAILGALLPTTGTTHAGGAAFAQAFTSGLHIALIVAGAAALAGAAVAAAFIQTTTNQQPQTDP